MSPDSVKALLLAGYAVHVERSPGRIYKDDEFEAVGAHMIPEGSWVTAPKDHIILGLKELPEDGSKYSPPHVSLFGLTA